MTVKNSTFFSSDAWDSYLGQLKRKCDKSESELAKHILKFSPETPDGNREFYTQMIRNLRQEIIEVDLKIKFINHLTSWIYKGPKLLPEMITFVKQFIPEEIVPSPNANITSEIFTTVMQQTFNNASRGRGLKSFMDDQHDPHYWGNPPYYLCSMDNTRFIRMPNVLKEKNPGEPRTSPEAFQVIEEFENYLKTLEEGDKKHLYVNLISLVKHDEGKCMVEKIHEIEKDPKFNQRLHIVTCDKNSKFYQQINEFENLSDATEFKKKFLYFLFDTSKEGAYRWSIHMNLSDWEQTCESLIDDIHKAYFNEKEILSVWERKDFIEIMTSRMIQALVEILDVNTCNISCKNSTDRGPGSFALTYLDYRHTKKQNFLGKHFLRVLAVTIAQPILIQMRSPYEARISRLISAGGRILAKHKTSDPDALAPEWKMSPIFSDCRQGNGTEPITEETSAEDGAHFPFRGHTSASGVLK